MEDLGSSNDEGENVGFLFELNGVEDHLAKTIYEDLERLIELEKIFK